MPTAAESDTLLTLRWHIAAALRMSHGGIGEPESEAIAAAIVEALQGQIGGTSLYIPAVPAHKRYEQIRQLANGSNRDEICHCLHIGKTTYYRAFKRKP